MPVIIACKCGQKLPIKEDMLGKKVRCPKCNAVLQLPAELPSQAQAKTSQPSAPPPGAPAAAAGDTGLGDLFGDLGSLGFEGDPSDPSAPKPAAPAPPVPPPAPVPVPPPAPAPVAPPPEPTLEEPSLEEPPLDEPPLEEPTLSEPTTDYSQIDISIGDEAPSVSAPEPESSKEEPPSAPLPEPDDIKLDLDTDNAAADAAPALDMGGLSLESTNIHSSKHDEAEGGSPLSESFVGPTHESDEEKTKKQEAIQRAQEAAEGLAALGEPPPEGSDHHSFKCSIHKKTPATAFCPQCRHPYCGQCFEEYPGKGELCYYCREPLVKHVYTVKKVAKRKSRIKWSAVLGTLAASIVVGLIAFWQIYQPIAPYDLPPEVTIEELEPAPGNLPPMLSIEHVDPPPGTPPPWAPAQLVSPPPEDLPPLIAIHLLDPAPQQLPPEAPLELVSPELAAILKKGSELRGQIFEKLETDIKELKEAYTKGDSNERTRVLKELFDLDHRLSLSPIAEALADPDEKVRGLAATELGRFGSSRAVKPLADALPKEKSSTVRSKIVSALKTCGDESAFPALINALEDPEFNVRSAAYTALRRLSSESIPYSAVKDPAEQKESIAQWRAWYNNSINKVIHGDWYRMRTPIGQAIAVNRFKGPQVRSAIDNALKWLISVKVEKGYWDQKLFALKNPETDQVYVREGHNLGYTGLALLAFLANGHTPETGDYKETVAEIVDWLIGNQLPNGRFQYKNSMLYGHGICTMAICEVYGMTGEARYKQPALKAIEYIVSIQGRQGGFGYNGPGHDVSVSGWQFMGMAAAMEAGLHVPEKAIQKARYFLNFMFNLEDGSTYYSVDAKSKEKRGGSTAMTSVGIVCRQFLEYPKTFEEIQKSMDKLRSVYGAKNEKRWTCNAHNPYEMYYTTLAMFQLGGEDWAKWNSAFREELLELQEKEGPFKGAWPEKVHHGTTGGRLYSTTISALCLSVYYRYPPIYK